MQSEKIQQGLQAEQQGTEKLPLVVKMFAAPDTVEKAARDEERSNEKVVEDRTLTIATIFLAVFTFALWYVTYRLARDARETSNRQAVEMTKSLAIAKESADAARLSADTAVALELPLFVIEKTSIAPKSGNFSITLGNHGRTPAIITGNCFVIMLSGSLPPMPRYPINNVDKVAISRIVERSNEIDISRPPSISENEWALVYTSQAILWVYGYLDYIDFLKKKRRTGFCVAFLPRPDVMHSSSTPNKGDWVQEGPSAYSYDMLIP